MIPDSNMHMGESFVSQDNLQVDHLGEVYMLQHVPTIYSIEPTSSGMLGGANLTIKGDGFTVEKTAADVVVSGIPCEIKAVSLTEIICALGAADDIPASADGAEQPGPRGIDRRIWRYGASLWDGNSYPDDAKLRAADVNDTSLQLFEAPTVENDPLGNFRGFFSPPVTGAYTLVGSVDDQASVWVAPSPYNTSREVLERVIRITDWNSQRDFDRLFPKWSVVGYMNPVVRVKRDQDRRSRKMYFQKGSAYFMDAWYRSPGGGVNFALAAILHNTTLNEKDKPTAIDEKQVISLHIDTQYAVYNLSLRGAGGGAATGEFKVRLGTKESRRIPANASPEYMTAVLRELFSNCEIAVTDTPLERDSAGVATDCSLGLSTEYRGMKSTTKVCVVDPALNVCVGVACVRSSSLEIFTP